MKASHGVVIIDENRRRREDLAAVVIAERVAVVASSGQGLPDIHRVIEKRPGIVFVGLGHPTTRGLQAIQTLSQVLPETAVIALCSDLSTSVFQQVIRAGGRYLLRSPIDKDEVRSAIRAFYDSSRGEESLDKQRAGRVITIAGQKGGVGKTTVAVNVAAALASETQASVLIADFDMAFGDVALALDVRAPFTAAQAAQETPEATHASLKQRLVEHESGAFILSAPDHYGDWMSVRADELERLVGLAAGIFDFVIVDTPGAYNDAVAMGLSVADHALIVSSLEMTSAKNTGMLVGMLAESGYPREQILVVANHTMPKAGLTAGDLASALQLPAIWEIPFDKQMRMATQLGKPLVLRRPQSNASKSLRALAHRVSADTGKIDRRAAVREGKRASPADLRIRLVAALERSRLAQAS